MLKPKKVFSNLIYLLLSFLNTDKFENAFSSQYPISTNDLRLLLTHSVTFAILQRIFSLFSGLRLIARQHLMIQVELKETHWFSFPSLVNCTITRFTVERRILSFDAIWHWLIRLRYRPTVCLFSKSDIFHRFLKGVLF